MAALAALTDDPEWRVAGLLTTFNEVSNRVAMHATPLDLVRSQALALGLPLIAVGLPEDCDNPEYERRVSEALKPLVDAGLSHVAVGDLFLEDIRRYREQQFRKLGLEAIFPLWGRDTDSLAREMQTEGWVARVCCVDAEQLDPAFLGRLWNADMLSELPEGVDPCGENGEFHTFCIDGPLFSEPLAVTAGETVVSGDRFHMLDLQPA